MVYKTFKVEDLFFQEKKEQESILKRVSDS